MFFVQYITKSTARTGTGGGRLPAVQERGMRADLRFFRGGASASPPVRLSARLAV
jgi:hypothetical protein